MVAQLIGKRAGIGSHTRLYKACGIHYKRGAMHRKGIQASLVRLRQLAQLCAAVSKMYISPPLLISNHRTHGLPTLLVLLIPSTVTFFRIFKWFSRLFALQHRTESSNLNKLHGIYYHLAGCTILCRLFLLDEQAIFVRYSKWSMLQNHPIE